MNKTDREKESLDELKAIQSSQDYTEYKEIIKSKKPEVQTIQEKPPQQWKTTYSMRTHKNQCQIAYYYMNWEFVFGGVPCAADFCHCHIHFVAQIFVENGWIHFRLLDFFVCVRYYVLALFFNLDSLCACLTSASVFAKMRRRNQFQFMAHKT